MARTTGRCARKKNPAHPLHCTPCRVCAPWRGSRVRGGPRFFIFFWDQKEKRILNPLYPFSQKKVCKVCKPCSTLFTTPLVPRVTSPPLPAPLTAGFTLLHRTNLTPTHSSPYPNQKKEALCTTPPHDSHVSCQISARRCHQEATAVSCNTCPVVCAIAGPHVAEHTDISRIQCEASGLPE